LNNRKSAKRSIAGNSRNGGRRGIQKEQEKESVMITASDLSAIINSATVMTASDIDRLKSQTDGAKQALALKAKERKEKMMQMEKEKANQHPPTESERRQMAIDTKINNHAKRIKDEELDDVKHMNQMALYAKCVTIRDAQLLEKARMQEARDAEDARINMEMEMERRRAIKEEEEKERIKAQEQRLGARVIIQQMAEREAQRVREQEQREQEAMLIMQRIKEQEIKDEKDKAAKIIQNRKMMEEVVKANNEQAQSKLRKKEEELEEERRIHEYIRQKEIKERLLEEEAERIAAAKESEIAKMRTQQEKGQDRQAQIDELRAKRYQEQKERQWREQQLEIARKKELIKQDMIEARERQRMEKARLMAEQALQEREDFQRILEWSKQQSAIDSTLERQQKEKLDQYRIDLMTQIHTRTKEKQLARQRFLQEGKNYKGDLAAQKERLEELKQIKLKALEKAGVPLKYRSELAAKEMLKSTIH
jgi:hypothetical protein